jgi:hypothetical protein
MGVIAAIVSYFYFVYKYRKERLADKSQSSRGSREMRGLLRKRIN